ncbi:hypothetical protein A2W70_03145 [Candidatus Curtissbacteria bacterium RIFCSPLOWO2_02_41_11]|uniref:Uncharacterized protein n=1 Tax=Candidatus Curtissbacteria bacterium RIFCSPLOWO2_02_41_11 TaxID=1797731 RepID=A0A1F5HT22_9BACT|nr:MAG: hypothetical protein A2W70_03145 [Candidatus Curtissbacteria bacterium RIFCSPLOWO2_02_41_11]
MDDFFLGILRPVKFLIGFGISYLIVSIFLKKLKNKFLKQLIMSIIVYLIIGCLLTIYVYLKVRSIEVFDYLLRWPDMLLWIWWTLK